MGAGYALRAGIGAAGEAIRQKLNYGCINDAGAVFVAGMGSVASDGLESGIRGIAGEEMGRTASVLTAGTSAAVGGNLGQFYAAQQATVDQAQDNYIEFRAIESNLH
jgi:hypothetical protein